MLSHSFWVANALAQCGTGEASSTEHCPFSSAVGLSRSMDFEEGMSSVGYTFVYAPLNGLLQHVVSVLAGNESWLGISHSG
jgi:hypothetical protein